MLDGCQPLDLVGPHEVFQYAGELSCGCCCQVVAPWAGLVRSRRGLPVHATHGVAELDPGGIDTLVVAGGGGGDQARLDRALVRWIAAAGAGARRVTSGCSGGVMPAAARPVTGPRGPPPTARPERPGRTHPPLRAGC